MRLTTRRRIDLAVTIGTAVVFGVVAAIISGVGDRERISDMWIGATLAANGDLAVTEVIDYDFGLRVRHGIFRDIPDLASGAPVDVQSDTAPDDVSKSRLTLATRLPRLP